MRTREAVREDDVLILAWTYVTNDPVVVSIAAVVALCLFAAVVAAGVITARKAHWAAFFLGVVFFPVWLWSASRLAKPWSVWAARRYDDATNARATDRYGAEPHGLAAALERSIRRAKQPLARRIGIVLLLFAALGGLGLAGIGPCEVQTSTEVYDGGRSLPVRNDFNADAGDWAVGEGVSVEKGRLFFAPGAEPNVGLFSRLSVEPVDSLRVTADVIPATISPGDIVAVACGLIAKDLTGYESLTQYFLTLRAGDPGTAEVGYVRNSDQDDEEGELLSSAALKIPLRPKRRYTLAVTCGAEATLTIDGARAVSGRVKPDHEHGFNVVSLYVVTMNGHTRVAFDDVAIDGQSGDG